MWLYDDERLCFVCLFAAPVTLNTMNSGRYDDSFIDQLPRLLPIMSEMDRKLLPLSKAIRKKYFRNVDLDQEDQFRPKYVEVHNSQLTEQLLTLICPDLDLFQQFSTSIEVLKLNNLAIIQQMQLLNL